VHLISGSQTIGRDPFEGCRDSKKVAKYYNHNFYYMWPKIRVILQGIATKRVTRCLKGLPDFYKQV
jgi:hypothetical protein